MRAPGSFRGAPRGDPKSPLSTLRTARPRPRGYREHPRAYPHGAFPRDAVWGEVGGGGGVTDDCPLPHPGVAPGLAQPRAGRIRPCIRPPAATQWLVMGKEGRWRGGGQRGGHTATAVPPESTAAPLGGGDRSAATSQGRGRHARATTSLPPPQRGIAMGTACSALRHRVPAACAGRGGGGGHAGTLSVPAAS